MEIIKKNIIYFKKYANGVLQEYKKRVACDKDETTTESLLASYSH